MLRAVSGGALALAAVAGGYTGGPAFAGLVAFLVVVMAFEWTRMVEGRELTPAFYALAATGALAASAASAGAYIAAYGACALGGLAAFAAARRAGRAASSWVAFGAAYFVAPCIALLWLRDAVDGGRAITLFLFLVVWSADSAAYFAGRFFGGPRLSPLLSPSKTWAGAAAGVLAGGLAGALCGPGLFDAGDAFGDQVGGAAFHVLIGASLGLASILGDLAESAFKRGFGVKDASGFIPGHGGALDRLDGMIFATVAMTAVLFGHSLASRL
ncbi:MAG: phosphatidate cytidylyltransferase [Parvularculaceae bacterium]